MSFKLVRCHKLLNRRDFNAIYQKGRRFIGKRLVFFYTTDVSSCPRLGITISKKWGKAHDRNRFKRISREAFRKLHRTLPKGLSINVYPKEGYRALTSNAIEDELKNLTLLIEKNSAAS